MARVLVDVQVDGANYEYEIQNNEFSELVVLSSLVGPRLVMRKSEIDALWKAV